MERMASASQPQRLSSSVSNALPVLRDKRAGKLRGLHMDKNVYNAFLHSRDQVRHLDKLRNELRIGNSDLARKESLATCFSRSLMNLTATSPFTSTFRSSYLLHSAGVRNCMGLEGRCCGVLISSKKQGGITFRKLPQVLDFSRGSRMQLLRDPVGDSSASFPVFSGILPFKGQRLNGKLRVRRPRGGAPLAASASVGGVGSEDEGDQGREDIQVLNFSGGSRMQLLRTTLPKGATPQDAEYMRMAVELARKAVGRTSPNPMVGCVIVKDGQVVGRGFHPKAGEPHAEVFALREAGKNAQGATAYVSLEPCNHTGRTPPCSQALVRARVSRVVVGTLDPNPLVGGKGIETLRKAGIQVVVGVEQSLCQSTAETFFHRIVTKKPFLTLRYTMSLDGAVLPRQKNETTEAGSHYSLLLQENDAVIVTDTCVHDYNPTLLSSEPGAKQSLRVVIAKSLELPLGSHVFNTSVTPTLVMTDADAVVKDVQNGRKHGRESMESVLRSRGVDVVAMSEMNLDAVLDLLYQKGFNSALVDSTVADLENYLGPLALTQEGPQKVVVVISPVLVGRNQDGPGLQLEDDVLNLERVTTKVCGGDVIVEGYISKRPS